MNKIFNNKLFQIFLKHLNIIFIRCKLYAFVAIYSDISNNSASPSI